MDDKWNMTEEKNDKNEVIYAGKEEKSPGGGFGKGFLGGFIAGLLMVAVIAGGVAVGRRLAQSRMQQNPTQSSQEAPGGDTGEDGAGVLTQDFIDEVNNIYQYISRYFLYDYDDKALQDGMLQGMMNALDDRYSVYYNESSLKSFNDQSSGEYYGIGCVVSQEKATGVVTLTTIYAGSPAHESGLQPEDILYAINDEEVTGMDLDTVVSKIKGAKGSTVKLTIVREGEADYLYFDVERRQVEIRTVQYEMLDGQIGYIAVSSFEGVTSSQFIAAYEELKAQGMQGLVIDMRGNGGGLLTAVEEMLDYLLPEGEIFYAKDKYGNRYLEYSSDAEAALDVPLAVLVNGNTASAAEVFSGNIQEFGVGTLVGTTTFGKGIMQNVLYSNAEKTRGIKLTVADYYIHSDRNIHKIGITPDVEVELDEAVSKQAVIEKSQDNQLQEALRIVRDQLR